MVLTQPVDGAHRDREPTGGMKAFGGELGRDLRVSDPLAGQLIEAGHQFLVIAHLRLPINGRDHLGHRIVPADPDDLQLDAVCCRPRGNHSTDQ